MKTLLTLLLLAFIVGCKTLPTESQTTVVKWLYYNPISQWIDTVYQENGILTRMVEPNGSVYHFPTICIPQDAKTTPGIDTNGITIDTFVTLAKTYPDKWHPLYWYKLPGNEIEVISSNVNKDSLCNFQSGRVFQFYYR